MKGLVGTFVTENGHNAKTLSVRQMGPMQPGAYITRLYKSTHVSFNAGDDGLAGPLFLPVVKGTKLPHQRGKLKHTVVYGETLTILQLYGIV